MNFDMTVTPTLRLHIGAGWSQFEFANPVQVTNFNPLEDIGLAGARLNRMFPAIASSAIEGQIALGGMRAMGNSLQTVSPERRPSGTVNLTWIKNNHTFKYGADWRFDMLPNLNFGNTAGNMGGFLSGTGQAGGTITGQPALNGVTLSGTSVAGFGYANFLLGSVRTFTLGAVSASRTSKHQWGAFAQDTWRVTRNLTLDIGLRWDLGTYTREDRGRNSNLSLVEPNPSASAAWVPGSMRPHANAPSRPITLTRSDPGWDLPTPSIRVRCSAAASAYLMVPPARSVDRHRAAPACPRYPSGSRVSG
jgi:hypothetical protein